MSIRRRGSGNPAHGIRPETVAYISGERGSPDYPQGMNLFWHRFSLSDGHVHAKWGYSVEQAAEQLGVDVEALRQHYGISRRYAWMTKGAEGVGQ
jgi:phosphopantetheinyl transferase